MCFKCYSLSHTHSREIHLSLCSSLAPSPPTRLQPFVISNKSIKWKPKKTLTKFLHIFNENKVTYYCSIADLFFLSFLLFWWTPSSLFAFKPNCQIQSNTFHGKWEINLHSNINLTLHHPDLFLLLSKCLYLYSNFSI